MKLKSDIPEPIWIQELTGDRPLVVADNLEFMPLIPSESVDLIITSPPYPKLRSMRWVTADKWIANNVAAFREIVRILNPVTGVLVLNVAFPRTEGGHFDDRVFVLPSLIKGLIGKKEAGLIDVYIWNKPNAVPAGNLSRHDFNAWEPVYAIAMSPDYPFTPYRKPYNEKTLNKYQDGNKTRAPGVGNYYAGGHSREHPEGARQSNVLTISSSGDQNRPRAKGGSFPRDLVDRFIVQYAPPNAVIFDPWAGVGTTVLQGIVAGHSAFGCDIDKTAVYQGRKWIHKEIKIKGVQKSFI